MKELLEALVFMILGYTTELPTYNMADEQSRA